MMKLLLLKIMAVGEKEERMISEMYDMHCHILPGVDDGADDIEEAMMMAQMAKENGIDTIFATPHYIEGIGYNDATVNQKILDDLNTELARNGMDIRVYLGNEVYSTLEVLKLLDEWQITTLNNSNYILIELPMLDVPMYIESMIYELKLKGITPIIAHPERNAKIIEDPNILYNFILKGALAQLNLSSLLGMYGDGVKDTAERLVEHDMIHFVGTDAHKPKNRYYRTNEAIDILRSLIDEEKVFKIIKENPESIINGNIIKVCEPKQYVPKRGFRKLLEKLMKKY